jgi:hypothetical protein
MTYRRNVVLVLALLASVGVATPWIERTVIDAQCTQTLSMTASMATGVNAGATVLYVACQTDGTIREYTNDHKTPASPWTITFVDNTCHGATLTAQSGMVGVLFALCNGNEVRQYVQSVVFPAYPWVTTVVATLGSTTDQRCRLVYDIAIDVGGALLYAVTEQAVCAAAFDHTTGWGPLTVVAQCLTSMGGRAVPHIAARTAPMGGFYALCDSNNGWRRLEAHYGNAVVSLEVNCARNIGPVASPAFTSHSIVYACLVLYPAPIVYSAQGNTHFVLADASTNTDLGCVVTDFVHASESIVFARCDGTMAGLVDRVVRFTRERSGNVLAVLADLDVHDRGGRMAVDAMGRLFGTNSLQGLVQWTLHEESPLELDSGMVAGLAAGGGVVVLVCLVAAARWWHRRREQYTPV